MCKDEVLPGVGGRWRAGGQSMGRDVGIGVAGSLAEGQVEGAGGPEGKRREGIP